MDGSCWQQLLLQQCFHLHGKVWPVECYQASIWVGLEVELNVVGNHSPYTQSTKLTKAQKTQNAPCT